VYPNTFTGVYYARIQYDPITGRVYGGDGTVEALVAATGGERRSLLVRGPLDQRVQASYGLLEGGAVAVIEMARASGLALLAPDRRDPRITTTFGVGELLQHAYDQGARRFIVGIGGSATNDGGAGMAQALGYHLLDARGLELPPGGAALASLDRIHVGGVHGDWSAASVQVASDVTNPLTGPHGASAVSSSMRVNFCSVGLCCLRPLSSAPTTPSNASTATTRASTEHILTMLASTNVALPQ